MTTRLGWLASWRRRRAPEPLSSWYLVRCDDSAVHLDVRPPGREAWSAAIPWDTITRVCFEAEGLDLSDGIYIFTSQRAESHAIPVEASGGHELWTELLRRGLFDAGLAATAMAAADGVFCWPGPDQDTPGAG